MMVKNEEKFLDKCLKYLQNFMKDVDSELIIVDTGSEDATVDIARRYTEKVYFHKWNNNFSEMRNITIDYAEGEWILIIDADEMLINYHNIANFLNSEYSEKYNTAFFTVKNISGSEEWNYSTISSARIFRNDGEFRYEGAVHNKPIFKEPCAFVDALIEHYGYLFNDKDFTEKKFLRTATILKEELEKDPENIYYWYQLSVSYSIHNDEEEALNCANNALKFMDKIVREEHKNYIYVYTQLALCYLKIRDFNMVEYVCNKAVEVGIHHIDVYYLLGKSQLLMKKNHRAIEDYIKYLKFLEIYKSKENAVAQTYFHGKREFVYFDLFVLYKRIGNFSEAVKYFNRIKDDIILSNDEGIEENISLYLHSNNFKGLKEFYKNIICKYHKKDIFILYLEKYIENNRIDTNKIINIFDENDLYTELLKLRLLIENRKEELINNHQIINNISSLDFNNISYFYGDILYYHVKFSFSQSIEILKKIDESKLMEFFNYLNNKYDDFIILIYKLLNFNFEEDLNSVNLKKVISKYMIVSTNFECEDYKEIFKSYIEKGIKYLLLTYNYELLKSEDIYYLKDEEEVFFKYIYIANLYRNSDEMKYVHYLKRALKIYPYMHKGIKLLLDEFQENSINDEMEKYKKQVIENIETLIKQNKLEAAKELINEYEKIIHNDDEVQRIKLMFHKMEG